MSKKKMKKFSAKVLSEGAHDAAHRLGAWVRIVLARLSSDGDNGDVLERVGGNPVGCRLLEADELTGGLGVGRG